MLVDDERVAGSALDACLADGQWARNVSDAQRVPALRAAIRREARARGVRIRTAVMDSVIVAVRLDADIWSADAGTMRRKLTPPPGTASI